MCTKIQMQGPVYNTRDLGGIPTREGHVIRKCRLIRSGALGKCTDEDIHILTTQYHLHTVIDLRTAAEKEEAPDPAIQGVHLYHTPILSNTMLGITREGQSQMGSLTDMITTFMQKAGEDPGKKMGQIYPIMVTDSYCLKQLTAFFHILLEQEDGAVLWHCTAGKDRVGTTTALLLTALGVERERIIQDYLLTNQYLKPETESMIAAITVRMQDPKVAEIVSILNGADQSYIEAVFAETEKQCGSTEKFLEEKLGLTSEKIDLLRRKYLQ